MPAVGARAHNGDPMTRAHNSFTPVSPSDHFRLIITLDILRVLGRWLCSQSRSVDHIGAIRAVVAAQMSESTTRFIMHGVRHECRPT